MDLASTLNTSWSTQQMKKLSHWASLPSVTLPHGTLPKRSKLTSRRKWSSFCNPYSHCRLYHQYVIPSPFVAYFVIYAFILLFIVKNFNKSKAPARTMICIFVCFNHQVSYLAFFIFNFDSDRKYKDQEKLQQLEDEYQVSLIEECNKSRLFRFLWPNMVQQAAY